MARKETNLIEDTIQALDEWDPRSLERVLAYLEEESTFRQIGTAGGVVSPPDPLPEAVGASITWLNHRESSSDFGDSTWSEREDGGLPPEAAKGVTDFGQPLLHTPFYLAALRLLTELVHILNSIDPEKRTKGRCHDVLAPEPAHVARVVEAAERLRLEAIYQQGLSAGGKPRKRDYARAGHKANRRVDAHEELGPILGPRAEIWAALASRRARSLPCPIAAPLLWSLAEKMREELVNKLEEYLVPERIEKLKYQNKKEGIKEEPTPLQEARKAGARKWVVDYGHGPEDKDVIDGVRVREVSIALFGLVPFESVEETLAKKDPNPEEAAIAAQTAGDSDDD
jgi:hypothetical protein